MKSKNIFYIALSALLISQVFMASLSLSSFEKNYRTSLTSVFKIAGNDLKQNIENSIKFGKSLQKFLGIKEYFATTRDYIDGVEHIVIFDLRARVLHSDGSPGGVDRVRKDFKTILRTEGTQKIQHQVTDTQIGDTFYITYPIYSQLTSTMEGYAVISFSESVIEQRILAVTKEYAIGFAWIMLAAIIFLAVGIQLFIRKNRFDKASARAQYTMLFAIIGLSQLISSLFCIHIFEERNFELSDEKLLVVKSILADDIQSLLDQGIALDKLVNVEDKLRTFIKGNLEIKGVDISKIVVLESSDTKNVLYSVETQAIIEQSPLRVLNFLYNKDNRLYVHVVELHEHGGADHAPRDGEIDIFVNDLYLESQASVILLDFLTVLLVSFLFLAELIILMYNFSSSSAQSNSAHHSADQQANKSTYLLIRSVAFIFLFSMDLTVSFLPLHARELSDGFSFWGISEEVIIGLPMSVELFFAGLILIVAGAWTDKRGWQVPFFVGISLCTVGALLSFFAVGILDFIIYRGIVGLGYGLTWMSFQGYVVYHSAVKNRAKALANLTAGVFVGSLCGGAVGGMLAERIGRAPIFLVSMAFGVLAVFAVRIFLQHTFDKSGTQKDAIARKKIPMKAFFTYLLDRNVLALLSLAGIPFAIAFVGFLQYATPVYLNGLGVSESNIARVIMIYGLSLVYIGPFIGRILDQTQDKVKYIYISGLLIGSAFLVFYFAEGLWVVAGVVFILSISAAIGGPARPIFAIEQPTAKALGNAQAMAVYRSFERFGQVLGPILMGMIIASGNFAQGIVSTGVVFLVMTMLFFLITRKKKRV